MKKFYQIRTIIKNYSQYPRELVWENAQDLEHVTRLHPNTNQEFYLLDSFKTPNSKWIYDTLTFRAVRKVAFIRFSSFGFRKILSDYNMYQFEYLSLFNVTSMLNSLLYESDRADYKTLMVDEVVLNVPWYMKAFEKKIVRELHEHAIIQCEEDEPFRQRRQLLKEKNVHRPLRLFAETHWDSLASAFQLSLEGRPEDPA